MGRVRTAVLSAAGASWFARQWASRSCKAHGITVRSRGGVVDLQRNDRVLRIAAKHLLYAPTLCAHFDELSGVLLAREVEGVALVDFSTQPDLLNLARMCLPFGAVIQQKGEDTYWLRKGNRAMSIAPRHLIYVVDMAEKFEIYFSPLVPTELDGVQVLDFSRPGILQTYAASGLQFEMASFPEEEEALAEYLRWYRPQPGDLVFDIGAHCGVSTYQLSKLVGPEGRVIAFEPDPGNYRTSAAQPGTPRAAQRDRGERCDCRAVGEAGV